MIRGKISKVILLGLILFTIVVNVSPMILRALEYRTGESVPKISEQQPVEKPATMTYTVDSTGVTPVTNYVVNLYDAGHGTDSINWVQHVYVIGVIADWVDIVNGLETLREIYDAAMMPLLLVLLMSLQGNRDLRATRGPPLLR